MNKETCVQVVQEEIVDYLKDDKSFQDYLTTTMSRAISDKIINILEKEKNVILKDNGTKISVYHPTNSFEYRRDIEWEPLVFCKDCVHFGGFCWCNYFGFGMRQNDYCSRGERRY